MQKILGAGSVLLLLNTLWLLIRSGPFNNTFLLSLGLFLGTGFYFLFYKRLRKIQWLNYAIVIFVSAYAGLAAFAMIYGRTDTVTFYEDVAIVLGTGLQNDQPTLRLQKRLDAAVYFHSRNPDAFIVTSGGLGRGEQFTEAYVMARYLVQQGVSAHLIIQEGGSHSTYQNMRLSAEILEEKFADVPQVVVITNDFHIYRGVRFARIAGMPNPTSLHANTPLLNLPQALVREVAAIVKLWVIGR